MIEIAMVVPLLRESCPTFRSRQDEHYIYGEDKETEPYLDVAEFVHYLIALLDQNHTEDFPAVFGVVERLITEGDNDVQTLATVGLLETLQNNALNRGLDLNMFVQWLGPESSDAWFSLIRDWGQKSTGAELT